MAITVSSEIIISNVSPNEDGNPSQNSFIKCCNCDLGKTATFYS